MINMKLIFESFKKTEKLHETIIKCEEELDSFFGISPKKSDSPHHGTDYLSEEELCRFLSNQIKAAREKKGWRQIDLAQATGIARPNIARLESGKRLPSLATLHKVSHALDTTIVNFMGLN